MEQQEMAPSCWVIFRPLLWRYQRIKEFRLYAVLYVDDPYRHIITPFAPHEDSRRWGGNLAPRAWMAMNGVDGPDGAPESCWDGGDGAVYSIAWSEAGVEAPFFLEDRTRYWPRSK